MKQITVRELAAHCAAQPSTVLLDVREPWELQCAALGVPGAELRHVPMREVPAALATLDPSQPVVCVCHHGVRSAHVAAFLERQGFDDVYNLAGGIDAWSTQVDPSVPRY